MEIQDEVSWFCVPMHGIEHRKFMRLLYNWRAPGPVRRKMVRRAKRLQRYVYTPHYVLRLNKAGRLILY